MRTAHEYLAHGLFISRSSVLLLFLVDDDAAGGEKNT
jgi:hypothetical protein